MAWFSPADDTMSWLGRGNVAGVLLRSEPYGLARQEGLLLRARTISARLPEISASVLGISYGDTLIFATDGMGSGFADNLRLNGSHAGDRPAHRWESLAQHDGAFLLVARYVHNSQPKS